MGFCEKLLIMGRIMALSNWFQVISARTLFRSTELGVYRTGAIVVIGVRGDEILEIPNGRMYWPSLRKFLPKGEITLLDLGANVGAFPLMLLRRQVKLRKVCSVEMNPHTFRRLRFNLEENLKCELFLYNNVVLGNPVEIVAWVGAGSSGDSVLHKDPKKGERLQMHAMTLDDIIEKAFKEETIDLCKIDVEGAEYDIFAGKHCERLRQCKVLIMEIHKPPPQAMDEADLLRAIGRLGFVEQTGMNAQPAPVRIFINDDARL